MLNCDKIREIRERMGLTQTEAAKRAGFKGGDQGGKQQWYLIESGRRSDIVLSTLDKIAKALGISAKELLK